MKGEIYYSPYENDIKIIMDYCALKGYYFTYPEDVVEMWEKYSDERFYASWIDVNLRYLKEFIEFLDEEIGRK